VAFGHRALQRIGTALAPCIAASDAIGSHRVSAASAVLATLALAWALAAALGTPSLPVELAVVGPGSALLAWLTDRLLPWPRGLAAPALVGVATLAPRRPALAFGAVMAALGVVMGAGRLGADVGGVVTVGVGGAVAVLWRGVLAVVVLGAVTVYVRTGATRTEVVLPDP
jgi:hypothetical protein